MMPQKLNPDVAELVRGKAGTAIGRLAAATADPLLQATDAAGSPRRERPSVP
jgi:argininosuccinate lyase